MSPDVAALMREVEALGCRFTADGDSFSVKPSSPLTDVMKDGIRRYKPEILKALKADGATAAPSPGMYPPESPPMTKPAPVGEGAMVAPPRVTKSKRVPRWDAVTTTHADWLSGFNPPSGPIKLYPGVTIIDFRKWKRSILDDFAAGPSSPRAMYGALQKDLRAIWALYSQEPQGEA